MSGIPPPAVPPCPACGSATGRVLRRFSSPTFGAAREFSHVECGECGLISVQPRPAPAELEGLYSGARYYEETSTERLLADGFRERPLWKVAQCDRILAFLRGLGCRRGRLLDVGCGWGLFMERAAAAGFEPEGVDLSAEVVGYVTGKLGMKARAVPLAELEGGAYGAVSMLDVVEHVPDPVGFLREARRVLAPGGWLVANVPNAHGVVNFHVPRLLAVVRRRLPSVFLQHLSEFRAASLAGVLARAGFQTPRVRGMENWHGWDSKPPLKRVAWLALGLAGAALGMPSALVAAARNPE